MPVLSTAPTTSSTAGSPQTSSRRTTMTNVTTPGGQTVTPSDSLAGKVAVITGAARGIGYQVARTYADHGATVVVSDIDESAAAAAAQNLPDATAHRCDVRDEHSI